MVWQLGGDIKHRRDWRVKHTHLAEAMAIVMFCGGVSPAVGLHELELDIYWTSMYSNSHQSATRLFYYSLCVEMADLHQNPLVGSEITIV